ncbi:hypothetical protein VIN01S_19030 [Vibrio inusitatus NBRC 102082]|uniref:Uncharacterized protein n=1 Tax=Vibrio inusitatus NBRC 102082 TaxID=1219070 RepID=A0A4Y3HVA4_9VIBR|nr:hypothetical protein VIN01S_19030 [Vibrio inusitatus NBRC 102082]
MISAISISRAYLVLKSTIDGQESPNLVAGVSLELLMRLDFRALYFWRVNLWTNSFLELKNSRKTKRDLL